MRTLTAPQARCTRLACFGTQLRGAPQRPSSLCPMRAVKLNAFAVLKLASACHVSQNIFQALGVTSSSASRASKPHFHARSSLSLPPVRQNTTFTHVLRPDRHSRKKTPGQSPPLTKARPPGQTSPTLPRKTSSSTKTNIKSRPEGRLQS